MQIMIIMSIRLIMWSLCTAKVLYMYYVDYVHFMLIVYIIMFMCIMYPQHYYVSIAYQVYYDVCTSSHVYYVYQGYT